MSSTTGVRLNNSNEIDLENSKEKRLTGNSQQQSNNLQIPNSSQNLLVWPQHIAQIQSRQQDIHSVDLNGRFSVDPDLEEDDVNNSPNPEERGPAQNLQITDGKQDSTFSMNLIEEVRKYPCVWNVSLQSYKDKPRKMEAWRRISTSLKVAESKAVREFDRLKDNFRRCIRKREQATCSGCAGKKLPTCEFFGELSFLRDVMTGRKTDTNIVIDVEVPTPTPELAESLQVGAAISPCDADNGLLQPEIPSSRAVQKARKRRSDQIDDLLAISLANDLASAKQGDSNTKTGQQNDQDVLFCSSLVDSFKKLKGKKNKLAKMRVLEVLADFEDNE